MGETADTRPQYKGEEWGAIDFKTSHWRGGMGKQWTQELITLCGSVGAVLYKHHSGVHLWGISEIYGKQYSGLQGSYV